MPPLTIGRVLALLVLVVDVALMAVGQEPVKDGAMFAGLSIAIIIG